MKPITTGSIIAKLLKPKVKDCETKWQVKAHNKLINAHVTYEQKGELTSSFISNIFIKEGFFFVHNGGGKKIPLNAIHAVGDSSFKINIYLDKFTEQEMDCALCIFDEFINCILSEPKAPAKDDPHVEYVKRVQTNEGVAGLRSLAMDLAKPIEKAWRDNSDVTSRMDCFPFDLEFIPELLARAVDSNELNDIKNNPQTFWFDLTLEICNEQLGVSETTEIIENSLITDEQTELWDTNDLNVALAASADTNGVVTPISDAKIMEAAEYVVSEPYVKDTGRVVVNVTRGELLELKDKINAHIAVYEKVSPLQDHVIASANGCLRAIGNVLNIGSFACEKDFIKIDSYMDFFKPADAIIAPRVQRANLGDEVKRDHDARKFAIGIHALKAADSIGAIIESLGEKFTHEVTDCMNHHTGLDLALLRKDLLLVAEAWGGAVVADNKQVRFRPPYEREHHEPACDCSLCTNQL